MPRNILNSTVRKIDAREKLMFYSSQFEYFALRIKAYRSIAVRYFTFLFFSYVKFANKQN